MELFDDDVPAGDPPIDLEIWAEASGRFVLDGAIWCRWERIGQRAFYERPQNSWLVIESGARVLLELVGFGEGRDRREYYIGSGGSDGRIVWIDLADVAVDHELDADGGEERIEDLD